MCARGCMCVCVSVCVCVCLNYSRVGGCSETHTIDTAVVVIENMTIIDMRHTEEHFDDFFDNRRLTRARVRKDAS